ncbi:MAG: suppressor of fused domain protein [Planctomycetota bacterium]
MSGEQEFSEGGSRIERHETPDDGLVAPAEPLPGAHESIEGYFQQHFGEVSEVYHELVSHRVHLDVHIICATKDRPFHVLFTTGMSDLPMTVPEGVPAPTRAELMIALPASWPLDQKCWKDENNYWPIGVLKMLARMPHEYGTFLGAGHTIPNGDPPQPFAPNTSLCCSFLLELLGLVPDQGRVELDGGESIQFYNVMFLHHGEVQLKLEKGTDALLERFGNQVAPVLDVGRPDVTRSKPVGRKKRFGLF